MPGSSYPMAEVFMSRDAYVQLLLLAMTMKDDGHEKKGEEKEDEKDKDEDEDDDDTNDCHYVY